MTPMTKIIILNDRLFFSVQSYPLTFIMLSFFECTIYWIELNCLVQFSHSQRSADTDCTCNKECQSYPESNGHRTGEEIIRNNKSDKNGQKTTDQTHPPA